MVEAVGHCHQYEVVHRDLKPENMLYAGPEGTRSAHVLKVCDFGLSTVFDGGRHDLHRKVGTPGYVGPEVLTATEARGYGKECDLWSLGVILYVSRAARRPSATFWTRRFYGSSDWFRRRARRSRLFERDFPPLHVSIPSARRSCSRGRCRSTAATRRRSTGTRARASPRGCAGNPIASRKSDRGRRRRGR